MSKGMTWIRMYPEMLDDPKIGRLPDDLKWRFTSLCLLAGEFDHAGELRDGEIATNLDDIAWRLRCDIAELMEQVSTLVSAGLLHWDNQVLVVSAFAKRNGTSQEERRKWWQESKRRQRNVQQESNRTAVGPSQDGDRSPTGVQPPEAEAETEAEREAEAEAETDPSAPGAAAFTAYEDEIGLLTRSVGQDITDLLDGGIPPGWIVAACQEAAAHNKRSWAYARAIVERWVREGRGGPSGDKDGGGAARLTAAQREAFLRALAARQGPGGDDGHD